VGDACELAGEPPAPDCNNNNVLDECETDCNGNNVPDECDIALGVPGGGSDDVNFNGVPDECEAVAIALNEIHADPHPTFGDANGDGMVHTVQDEFLEFINASALPLDLSHWRVFDGEEPEVSGTLRHHFPAGTVLGPGCGIVVFSGGFPQQPFGGCLVQAASTGSLSLNNVDETITLFDDTFTAVLTASFTADDDASITLQPEVTGSEYTRHDQVAGAIGRFSPGTDALGGIFAGCPAPTDDFDGDGVPDALDNCPVAPNAEQLDCDRDAAGDVCELLAGTQSDADSDGIPDACEVAPPPAGTLWISEIRIDQPGADVDEYVELRGVPGTLLDGLAYVVIGDAEGDGEGGGIEAIVRFGQTGPPHLPVFIGAAGVMLMTNDTFTLGGTPAIVLATSPDGLNLENDDDVTHLLVSNFHGVPGQDVDVDDDGVVDGGGPWDVVIDAVSLVTDVNPAGRVNLTYAASLGFADGEVGPVDYGAGSVVPVHAWRCDASAGGDAAWFIGTQDPHDAASADTPGVGNEQCEVDEEPLCPCDIAPEGAGDSVITIADVIGVVTAFGLPTEVGAGGDCTPVVGQTVGDGAVTIADVIAVIVAFGPCPAA
jgi:hypothetical protein